MRKYHLPKAIRLLILLTVFFLSSSGKAEYSSWQETTEMRWPRHGGATVSANGFIYAIGGLYPSSYGNKQIPTGSVERGRLNPDGTIREWVEMPEIFSRGNLAAVVAKGYIYTLGGLTDNGQVYYTTGIVQRAKILADGSLSEWEMLDSIMGRDLLFAVYANEYIYVIGGRYIGQGDEYAFGPTERAKVNNDGSLGPWILEDSSYSIVGPAGAVVNGYIYAFGGAKYGFTNNIYTYSGISRAKINQDGSLQEWELLEPDWFNYRSAAVAVGNNIFVMGGSYFYLQQVEVMDNRVFQYTVDQTGNFSSIVEIPSLRWAHAGLGVTSSNGRLFAVGGQRRYGNVYVSDNTVEYSDVLFEKVYLPILNKNGH